jgi:hypothetical protein
MGTTVRGRPRDSPPTRLGGPILKRNVKAGWRRGKVRSVGGAGAGVVEEVVIENRNERSEVGIKPA